DSRHDHRRRCRHRNVADDCRADLWFRRLLFHLGCHANLLGTTLGFIHGTPHCASASLSLLRGIVWPSFSLSLSANMCTLRFMPAWRGAYFFTRELVARFCRNVSCVSLLVPSACYPRCGVNSDCCPSICRTVFRRCRVGLPLLQSRRSIWIGKNLLLRDSFDAVCESSS